MLIEHLPGAPPRWPSKGWREPFGGYTSQSLLRLSGLFAPLWSSSLTTIDRSDGESGCVGAQGDGGCHVCSAKIPDLLTQFVCQTCHHSLVQGILEPHADFLTPGYGIYMCINSCVLFQGITEKGELQTFYDNFEMRICLVFYGLRSGKVFLV